MAVSFFPPNAHDPAVDARYGQSGGPSADITAGAEIWLHAARRVALFRDLRHHKASRRINQQQAVVLGRAHAGVRA
jgi:hypothetical protein